MVIHAVVKFTIYSCATSRTVTVKAAVNPSIRQSISFHLRLLTTSLISTQVHTLILSHITVAVRIDAIAIATVDWWIFRLLG